MVKTAQLYYEEGKLKVKFEMKDGSLRSSNGGWHEIELDKQKDLPEEDDGSEENDPEEE